MREEQLRLSELDLAEKLRQRQMNPEVLKQIQEELRKKQLDLPEQERMEAMQKALEEQAAAIARYSTGLIDEARLSEMSKVLAEHLAEMQKDHDLRTSELTAEWAARKAELETALKQLSESHADSLGIMRQRAEIERLTAAYSQLLWRKTDRESTHRWGCPIRETVFAGVILYRRRN